MLNEVFAVKSHAWEHPQKVREVITHFLSKQQNGLYEVQIKRIRPHRTDPQNRLYWKLVHILAPEIGYESPDACHAMIMQECGFGKYIPFRGKQYFERKSSTVLDTELFGHLINKCYEIAAFLNEDREPSEHLILPKPEEVNP